MLKMAPESDKHDLPPYKDTHENTSKEILEATALVLEGQSVRTETTTSAPLYQINQSVTSTSQKVSTVRFERVEHDVLPVKSGGTTLTEPRNQHLFYLVHPVGAQYRTDLPAHYYVTSVSPEMVGNICFEISSARFQEAEFKALLSLKKNAQDKPLFENDERAQQLLFSAKPKWRISRHYIWTDSDGRQVAVEDGDGDQHKLIVTTSMWKELRDALVAMWILRLWHDRAESRQAKRKCKLILLLHDLL